MADSDPLEEVLERLRRLEHLVGRLAGEGGGAGGAPVRSARSIVGRLDDVWVAVTEGHERLADNLAGLRDAVAQVGDAVEELSERLETGLGRLGRQLDACFGEAPDAPRRRRSS